MTFLVVSTLILVSLVIIFLLVSFTVAIFGGGPFVPTPMRAVHEVLKHAKIKKADEVYDIGAGDGRFVHFAAKDYQANSIGFEIDPFIFFFAKFRQWVFGWQGKMVYGSFLKHSLKDADLVICYMLPRTLKKFQKKFDNELKPGTRVVSYAFSIGDWKPLKIIPRKNKISQIFVYEK